MRGMSKTARAVLILLIITVASFAIAGIMLYAQYGENNFADLAGNGFAPSGAVNVDEEKTHSVAGVNNIYISTTSEKINFITSDSDELKVRFYGSYSSSDSKYRPELTLTESGGDITVKVGYKSHIGPLMFNSDLKLDVYLPAAYAKSLDVRTTSADITIDEIASLEVFKGQTVSGSLTAKRINASRAELAAASGALSINGQFDSIRCSATSGNITSEDIQAKTAAFDTASGNIRVNAAADDLKLHSNSGEITAEQVDAKSCRAETASGGITLRGNPGKLEAASASGNIRLEYGELSNDISVTTTSGSTSIKLPENAEFRLAFNTASGRSKVDFPVTISGTSDRRGMSGTVVSDRNSIKVTSTSGDLNISK